MKTINAVKIHKNLISVRCDDDQVTVTRFEEGIIKFDRIMTMIEDNNEAGIFYSVSLIDKAEDGFGNQFHTLNHVQLVGLNMMEERIITTEFDAMSDGSPAGPVESRRTYCTNVTLKRDDGYTTLHEVLE